MPPPTCQPRTLNATPTPLHSPLNPSPFDTRTHTPSSPPPPAPQLATQIVGSLLALEALDETAPIRMYINSPGGTPYSIIGVVDAMQAVKPPIQTVALGACYSYSSLLLVRGVGEGVGAWVWGEEGQLLQLL